VFNRGGRMIEDLYIDKETGDIYEVLCHGKLALRKSPVVVYRDLDDEVWVMSEHSFYNGRFEKVE
jgi:hypothetical protein